MSIEFESPATRIIKQFSGKDEQQFRIPTDLPDLSFLRALSIQGRLRYNTASGSNGVTLTITPAVGETYFLYKVLASKVSGTGVLTVTNDGNQRIEMALDVTLVPTIQIELVDSLVGNGVQTLVVAIGTNATGNLTALGWVENTSRIRDVTI